MSLTKLPYDLLAPILEFLQGFRPVHLAQCCLVSHEFRHVATRLLYQSLRIVHWEADWRSKVYLVFATLSEHPELAAFVERIDLGVLPQTRVWGTLDETVPNGLKNCINLRSCRWTRDGTISDDILHILRRQQIRDLEINANPKGYFTPSTLLGFNNLERLALIMPDSQVIRLLPAWCSFTGHSLRTLSIICKNDSLITDILLREMGTHLVSLKGILLTNCSNFTHEAIIFLLQQCAGIEVLSLEGVSQRFNWLHFATEVNKHGLFKSLKRLTMTCPPGFSVWGQQKTERLFRDAPLEEFNLYSNTEPRTNIPQESNPCLSVAMALTNCHARSLQALGILRIPVDDYTLEVICQGLPRLRKLFFTRTYSADIWTNPQLYSLASLRRLEYFHISTIGSSVEFPVLPTHEVILSLVAECSPNLRQCGFGTKVWSILREFTRLPDGQWTRSLSLGPYDKMEVPEHFLVVRG